MYNLDELIESYRSILIAEKHLQVVEKDLESQYQKLNPLATYLDALADILEKEEDYTLRRLFSKTLVDEEQQYEIDKQEYLLAALNYKQLKKSIDLLEFEKKILIDKVKSKIDIEAKLNLAIDNEQMEIKSKYPQVQKRLFEINEALKDLINYRREIFEAQEVSNQVLSSLAIMNKELVAAQNLGDWGTFYAEIQKTKRTQKNHIDVAYLESSKIIQLLKKLKKELEDIVDFKPMTKMYAFDELMHFQDQFNDSLITDWVVKNDIKVSLHKVDGTKIYMDRIMRSLNKYKQKAELKYQQLKESKAQVIRSAQPIN